MILVLDHDAGTAVLSERGLPVAKVKTGDGAEALRRLKVVPVSTWVRVSEQLSEIKVQPGPDWSAPSREGARVAH